MQYITNISPIGVNYCLKYPPDRYSGYSFTTGMKPTPRKVSVKESSCYCIKKESKSCLID